MADIIIGTTKIIVPINNDISTLYLTIKFNMDFLTEPPKNKKNNPIKMKGISNPRNLSINLSNILTILIFTD